MDREQNMMQPQMAPQQMPQMPQEQQLPEDAGRGGDTVLAHMSLGELVIPRIFMDDPDFVKLMKAAFEHFGGDINEFTVGHQLNKINPDTGYAEFGWFKKFFKKVAPFAGLALAAIPGLQGVGLGLGSALLGSGAAGASTLGNALLGGGLGYLGGGGKGAMLGGALGGLGANLGKLGSAPLKAGAQGASLKGSGLMGALGSATGLNTGNTAGLTSLSGGLGGGGSSFSPLGAIATAAGGFGQDEALKKQQEQLLGANQQQLANLGGFDPSQVTEQPGYQFNLEQGQKGLNRALGAQGNVFSGRALKAASEYNQNYANNAYKDYYNQWANKTGAQNALLGAGGNIQADTTGGRASNLAQSLSGIFNQKKNPYDYLYGGS